MKRIFALLAFASGVFACQGVVESSAFLSRVREVVQSAKCPDGGVAISNGKDLDGDGQLSARETTSESESEACSGTAGRDGAKARVPLFRTTMTRAGDADCPTGGVRIDFGYDVAADAGPGDGVLADEEIETTRFICNGAAVVYPQSTRAPEGAAGTSVISAAGGDSMSGDAGQGGSVSVTMAGTLGGNIKLVTTGAVDAGFEVPAVPFAEGSNVLRATSDLTLRNFNNPSDGLASGDEYFQASGTLMRRVDGRAVEVTSVDVAAGVTLTTSGLYVTGDVRNAGTIRGMPDYNDFAALNVLAKSFWGLPGSMLIAQSDSPDFSGAVLISCPMVVNQGRIVVSGLDQPLAGPGGRVQLTGKICVNTGSIEARGGTGRYGGPGGRIAISSQSLDSSGGTQVWNSGALDASGGPGTVRSGAGGEVFLSSNSPVSFRNAGSLTARGGSCDPASADCTGGNGGRASLSAAGADLLSSATVDVSAGAGAVNAVGASGGRISFAATDLELSKRLGSIRVSGALTADGSKGSPGGAAGPLDFDLLSGPDPRGEGIELLGYASAVLNGGKSQRGIGGSGGWLLARMLASTRENIVLGPAGAIVSNIDVAAKGGDGLAGGRGGALILIGPAEPSHVASQLELIKSSGSIDLHGGAGRALCGEGGAVDLRAPGEINVNGRFNLAGGSFAESSAGGRGGRLFASSMSALHMAGELVAAGGAGHVGGPGGTVWIGGSPVDSSSAFDMRGGNATERGGSGGVIQLVSYFGQSVSSGELLMAGGSGGERGQTGVFRIDGYIASH